jgi:lipopolysaccharide transport system ATP-binding protein
MEPTLIFDGVWKRFRRGQVHDSLRELIPAVARRFTGKKRDDLEERDFWALTNLSFEVKPGEVLGIIGTNGAGKSTTLKILNQLMEPTKGQVYTRGKIGSLIEVSAGFHQDLTGRQNVFLQGSIMGMSKQEVTRKFDQIVDFSGISEFIDTPVKRYSSGMNARLGFSIAVHLEPDILIIDEVLAVGDHAFQQRAFSKIKGMATSGAPVVLVSHQLDRIAELCTKVILLEKGAVKAEGSAMYCINAYLHPPHNEQTARISDEVGIRFDDMEILGVGAVYSGEPLSVMIKGESSKTTFPQTWQMAFRVINANSGAGVYSVLSTWRDIPMPSCEAFSYRLDLQMNLEAGNYFIESLVWNTEQNEDVLTGPRVNVEVLQRSMYYGTAQLNSAWNHVPQTADVLST